MTNSESPVLQAEQRSWNYWFLDGLPNLVGGITCLLAGFAILGLQARPRRPLVTALSAIAMVLYIVALVCIKRFTEWLKARITYPRTGYAAPPYFTDETSALPVDLTMLTLNGADAKRDLDAGRLREFRNSRAMLTIAIMALGLAAALYVSNRWICLAAGAFVALALWVAARTIERASWIGFIGFPFAAMYMITFHVGKADRMALFIVGGGAVLVLSGCVRLLQYLRRNPAPHA